MGLGLEQPPPRMTRLAGSCPQSKSAKTKMVRMPGQVRVRQTCMCGRLDQKHFRVKSVDSAERGKHWDLKMGGLGRSPQGAERLKEQITNSLDSVGIIQM